MICVTELCIWVRGCLWRSGGLDSLVILSSFCRVQSYIGCCWKYILNASMEGLIVMTNA